MKAPARKPLLSIITVTYNAAATLPTTLRSVAAQTFREFEHLIIDGASTDDTVALARATDARIVSEPDEGLYDAMNKGLELATGEYVMFLNAGDAFHSPDTLKHIAEAIERSGSPGLVYGQTAIVDSQGRYLRMRHLTAPKQLHYRDFARGMLVCHQSMVVLRKIAPRFRLAYRFSSDYEWAILVLQHSRHNIYLDEIITDYLNEGQTTRNHKESLRERFRIMCNYYGTVPTVIRHLGFALRHLRRKFFSQS